ncbi:trans-1,2-dihydrobenzene-1,2-diol dehydrogenase [Exaiptasia diaphana]|uniref:Trans-1,2-dihydrobenzene-1,2-diol dehydrogenase n=1 Tax=Exaiptasia diaphana TaxID=2652724 RepID=A0A913XKT5_EXADI|nr:trans-1,2-dihydrobenzene-1,2-diol dehydrogenase [Exaiptasia diaphana]KXJ25665.1 Trans-1,2-dihydrobenzene-1,2-diol dehydrogenase [Exaiptasia diaphana]
MSSSEALRWGILGAGKIANDFIIALKTLPAEEHHVVAIGASSCDKAQSLCRQHGVKKAYGSYKEVVSDPEVQVVYVSTIHPTHKELCLLALEHGKHVLCEKPMTLNLKDAKEVMQTARDKNLFFMEALWTRFFPLVDEVKNMIGSKEIGDVKVVMASFGFASLANIPRLIEKELGGGVLLDIGIYCLNMADIFFGGEKPQHISACGHKTSDDGVDYAITVTLLYSGNRMAQILASADTDLPNECIVCGSNGSVKICAPFWSSEKIIKSDGSEKEFPLPKPYAPMNFFNSTGMRYEIQAVRKSILSGKTQSEVMPHSTTERIMGWMDEIRRQIGVTYKEDN